MPQLMFPQDPLSIGIETSLLAYLFGLKPERAIMMGAVYFVYNVYINKRMTMMDLKIPKTKKVPVAQNNYNFGMNYE